jgi:hypothetical protein
VLELGDRSQDLEEHPPHRSRGVDALIEHDQIHAPGLELISQFDQMCQ